MTLPVPTLDHVVVNTRDRMDEAQACYERLGFQLTPRGYHTLGTVNHLAIFGTEYFELIGIPPGKTANATILNYPVGLNGLVFGTEDSRGVYEAMKAVGVGVGEPNEFSRPVELPGGKTEDAKFRTVRLLPETAPYGRVYFCHHFTRHVVWRDEWRRHANGTIGVVRAIICAANPDGCAELYRTMFGPHTVRPTTGGFTLAVGLSRFDILTPQAVAAAFGDTAPDPQGRSDYMVGLTLRTSSLDTAAGMLKGTARRDGARLVVPASAAFGATLEFVE